MPEAADNPITPTGLLGHVSTTDVGTVTPTAARTLLNVASGATANAADATLLDRANHTGTQATGTVTGLDAALAGKAPTVHTHTLAQVTDAGSLAGLSSVGTAQLTNDAVTLAKLANAAASSKLLGSGAAGAGADYVELTLGTNLSMSGTTLNAAGAGGVADGDKTDITVSSSGAVWTIDANAVTYAKIQNVTATDRVLGRATAGAGVVEEITCTAAGRALLDDANAAAQLTTLGAQAADATLTALAGLDATAGLLEQTGADTFAKRALGVGASTSVPTRADADTRYAAASHTHTLAAITDAGTLAGLSTVGTTQITNGAVTYAKIQNVTATDKLLGRSTAGAGVVEEITCTGAGRALLDDADNTAQRTTLGLGTAATSASTAFQASDATLTALAAVDATAGLLEQTGTDTFAKRALGVGAGSSIPTRADADTRYAAATHTHAQSDVTNLVTDLAAKAPLASPALTGTPIAPTAAADTSTTQIATTAYVQGELADRALTTRNLTAGVGISGGGDLAADRTIALDLNELTTDATGGAAGDFLPFVDVSGSNSSDKVLVSDFITNAGLAPLASPTFTGTPAAPTAATTTSTTQLATTAFVQQELAASVGGIGGHIETVANKTYCLDEKAPAAYTINSLARRTVSGSVTLAVQINGTNVTGLSALTGNSTPTETNASAANAVAAGARVTLVASANSSALDLTFTLKITG